MKVHYAKVTTRLMVIVGGPFLALLFAFFAALCWAAGSRPEPLPGRDAGFLWLVGRYLAPVCVVCAFFGILPLVGALVRPPSIELGDGWIRIGPTSFTFWFSPPVRVDLDRVRYWTASRKSHGSDAHWQMAITTAILNFLFPRIELSLSVVGTDFRISEVTAELGFFPEDSQDTILAHIEKHAKIRTDRRESIPTVKDRDAAAWSWVYDRETTNRRVDLTRVSAAGLAAPVQAPSPVPAQGSPSHAPAVGPCPPSSDVLPAPTQTPAPTQDPSPGPVQGKKASTVVWILFNTFLFIAVLAALAWLTAR